MDKNSRDWAFGSFAISVVVGIALLFVIFTLDPGDNVSFWLGEGGVFGALFGAGTLTAAVLAGVQAWRAYGLNEQAEAATRFQKGAELLATSSKSTQTGGLALLRTLGTQFPSAYTVPILEILREFIAEQSEEAIDRVRQLEPGKIQNSETWPMVPVVVDALAIVAQLAPAAPPRQLAPNGKMWIERVYVARTSVFSESFRNLQTQEVLVTDVLFDGCDFSGSDLRLMVGSGVVFKDCTFSNTFLTVRALSSDTKPSHTGTIRFVGDVKVRGGAVNSRPFDEWLEEHRIALTRQGLVLSITDLD